MTGRRRAFISEVGRTTWRAFKLAFLSGLVAGLVAAAVYPSWVAAQSDAIVVFTEPIETPGLTWVVSELTDEPRLEEISLAGSPTTIARPGGDGPWPAVVFLNGATRRGRFHPDVRAVARGLARAGYVAFVPDVPGVRTGEITTRTVRGAVAAVRAALREDDVEGGEAALYGVSTGASLALLVAEDASVAERITLVAGIAPYTDLRDVVRLATTGYHSVGGSLRRYDVDPFVTLVAARSLAAALPPGRDRRLLLDELQAVDDEDENPLAVLREVRAARLGRRATDLVELLVNVDPQRFDRLYARLPAAARSDLELLSPITKAGDLRAPVEIASAPHDKYFPVSESRELARVAPDVRITVTETLAHAIPEPSPGALGDLFRFDAFLVRVLHES
jgi:pimeloyl-ACP methyl ester carboxylesterase